MCLIAYSPTGLALDRDVFDEGYDGNPDGIGIMSAYCIERFVGKGSKRKAWRLLNRLALEAIPYAIHFRWRTHGPINTDLCHPFKSTDGFTYVMHNGVINETGNYALPHESDTSVFVRDFVDLSRQTTAEGRKAELDALESMIGYSNKLVILDMRTGKFDILNEDCGLWNNGIWYSNEYSLPARMHTWTYAKSLVSYARKAITWSPEEDTEDTTQPKQADYQTNGDYLAALQEWDVSEEEELERKIQQLKRGNSRWLYQKQEILPVDSEESYYRSLEYSGYMDDGTELGAMAALQDADEDYKVLLRRVSAAGGGH